MAGIAGIALHGASSAVSLMLGKMSHRGNGKPTIIEKENTTYGIIMNEFEEKSVFEFLNSDTVCDIKGPHHYAWVKPENGSFVLERDDLGVAPLYYGWDKSGNLCFASEIKALIPFVSVINELMPGTRFDGRTTHPFFNLDMDLNVIQDAPGKIADGLRQVLTNSVRSFISSDNIGSWLSGGLDSSAICALAAKEIKNFKTFVAGVKGAPDLEYAKEVASYIGSEHHEQIVTVEEMLNVLPEVIFHLESFDALLVRSSITNFLVAKIASQNVGEVFSGEGGDELFAGYEYLKSLKPYLLPHELVKITKSLHNTALQRVDRCSSAHGTIAHVPFLDPEVVKTAFSIPAKYKLHNGIEKWILRKALDGLLPERIINRPKAKFWEGAGVKEIISDYASKKISDKDFTKGRTLPNNWTLNTKEEFLYYSIFKDHFGTEMNLEWMGRTNGSPVE